MPVLSSHLNSDHVKGLYDIHQSVHLRQKHIIFNLPGVPALRREALGFERVETMITVRIILKLPKEGSKAWHGQPSIYPAIAQKPETDAIFMSNSPCVGYYYLPLRDTFILYRRMREYQARILPASAKALYKSARRVVGFLVDP